MQWRLLYPGGVNAFQVNTLCILQLCSGALYPSGRGGEVEDARPGLPRVLTLLT